jgi:hypothetical protein
MEATPTLDVAIISKPPVTQVRDNVNLLRKEEKLEEKREAREEAATNRPAAPSTNTVEVAKVSNKEAHPEEHEAHDKKVDGMTPGAGDRKDAAETAEGRASAHDAEHVPKDSSPEIAHDRRKNEERGDHDAELKKAVETKTVTAANQTKPANPPSEIKTPPLAPSHPVLHRIWQGFVTGGQSGAQYQNQNSRSDSRQHSQTQYRNNQPNQPNQQNQQNRNNENNSGGNGGGHSRH